MSLKNIQSRYQRLLGKKQEIKNRISSFETQEKNLINNIDELGKCGTLLSFISKSNQDKIINIFQHTVSSGLKDLFDDSYDFKFDMKTRGNNSACEFLVKNNTFPGWAELQYCHGRSVEEIVGTILRIVLIKLLKNQRKIVILDEPLGGVEKHRQRIASEFVEQICKQFDIQLIVVTHSDEFAEFANEEILIGGKERG